LPTSSGSAGSRVRPSRAPACPRDGLPAPVTSLLAPRAEYHSGASDATGDPNCSFRGAISNPQSIRPDGDATCAILFNRDGDTVTLLTGDKSCAYYCGPGASLEGRTFTRMAKPEPVTDLARDPLC